MDSDSSSTTSSNSLNSYSLNLGSGLSNIVLGPFDCFFNLISRNLILGFVSLGSDISKFGVDFSLSLRNNDFNIGIDIITALFNTIGNILIKLIEPRADGILDITNDTNSDDSTANNTGGNLGSMMMVIILLCGLLIVMLNCLCFRRSILDLIRS